VNHLGEFGYGDAQDMSYPAPGPPRSARHARATGPQPMPVSMNGRPGPGYPPANGAAGPAYPPVNGSGAPVGHRWYPPPGSQPGPRYTSVIRRPDPAQPRFAPFDDAFDGQRPPRYARPAPGYPPPNGRLVSDRAPAEDPPLTGKRILAWLPFCSRLVLLPKNPSPDGEELREHRDVSGGWLRPAVFGAMDGLVTNASLIAGVGGGGGSHGAIVLTGIAGLVAGAFSMATGEYISVTSQNELTEAEVELERTQHRRDPAGKQRRLTQVFIDKGVSPNLAEAVVRQISADPERAVATHVREELGIDPDDLPSPRTAAAASFAAFTVGALIPLSPFLIGLPNLELALGVAGLAAIAGGAAVAKLTNRSMLAGGLRQFIAAFLATGMAFVVGHAIGGRIG
jgi:vacuolar iron transporter family protein